jgi:hypothetical protein
VRQLLITHYAFKCLHLLPLVHCLLRARCCRFLYDRSQVLLDMQRWEDALSDMSAALDLIPDAASLHYTRGMAYFSKGDDARALKVGVQPVLQGMQHLQPAALLLLKPLLPTMFCFVLHVCVR